MTETKARETLTQKPFIPSFDEHWSLVGCQSIQVGVRAFPIPRQSVFLSNSQIVWSTHIQTVMEQPLCIFDWN